MSYWNRPVSTSSPGLDNTSLSYRKTGKNTSISDEFYEIEPAIVLDIILNNEHAFFKSQDYKLISDQWPVSVDGKAPLKTDKDFTWIGRALVRLVYSQKDVQKEELIWAIPLESNLSEYPLLNELVGVVFYMGRYYYTRKINTFNTVNADADFNLELVAGGFRNSSGPRISPVEGNRELINSPSDKKVPFIGPTSKLNSIGSIGFSGVLGRYFYYNPRIRSLKRREGDLIVESRFGQSIRFGAYDDNRNNDKGYNSEFGGYTDYKGNGYKYKNIDSSTYEAGGGNPMILIRNRQKPLSKTAESEKNVGGYMLEDVNDDGTSIHITSGITLSTFQTSCLKKMWGNGEEQSKFDGDTNFKYPKLSGDQMVVNSDRIIISAKRNEIFQYSKKRMAFVTDDEYTIDAQNQIIINTNNKTVINSPAIYLGEYNQTNEPVLLGQTTVNWLYDVCNWMIEHTHWNLHNHPDAQFGRTGSPDEVAPTQTQTSVQVANLIILREKLNTLLSRRVFVTGGGLAPGQNGVGINSININTNSGAGVPGGFNGSNYRPS